MAERADGTASSMAEDESPGVLSGVRVLDLSRIVAGPLAAQILGDFGADVIKIETPDGDESRLYGAAGLGAGPTFIALNRNKRSLVLDLKSKAGQEVIRALVRSADVLIHNFRSGVDEKLGLAYEQLRAENPRLIYCAISGFGSRGPLAEKPAVDLVAQAFSGLLSITGEPGRDPVRVPIPIGDQSAGLYAVIGVMMALFQRDRTGRGQKVETSLLEALLSLMGGDLTNYLATGAMRQRMGSQNRMGQPNQLFHVRDGLVAISVANDAMWKRFCQAVGADDLTDDPQYSSILARTANRNALVEQLQARLRRFTVAECVERLDEARVVCAPVQDHAQVVADPQVEALGILAPVDYGGRRLQVVRNPLRLSETPPAIYKGPSALNADADDILSELGFTSAPSVPDVTKSRARP